MWRFAWQNLVTRPTRTSLAVLGLTIPILAILGLFSLTQGIRALMGDTLAKMNGLMVLRANAPAPVFSDLPAALAADLRRLPGARIVAPEVLKLCPPIEGRNLMARAAVEMLTRNDESRFSAFAESILLEGMQLPEHLHLKSAVFAHGLVPRERGGGRYFRMEDVGKSVVMISTKIARQYPNSDGTPKKVGETLQVGGKPFTIIGLYETGSLLIDDTVVMEITTARALLSLGRDAVSALYVEPDQDVNMNDLAARITRAIPEVQVRTMAQYNLQVGNIMGKLDLFLLMTVGLALLVGGVGIANTMLMSATERFVEFGVMRANGWTSRNVLGLVTAESACLGLLSGVVASVLALAGIALVNAWLSGSELALRVTPGLIAASNATAVIIASVAGLYPAWRASRMTPMDAIRNEVS